MATCNTCGAGIEVPEGWSVGPAVRRHYWAQHADRMLRHRADRAAEGALPDPAAAAAPLPAAALQGEQTCGPDPSEASAP